MMPLQMTPLPTTPRPITGACLALLLAVLLAAGLAACTSGEKGARPPAPAPAGEVFESFDSDAFIEEETIAVPPEPAPPVAPPPTSGAYDAPTSAPGLTTPPPAPGAPPPEDRDRERRALPLSSPGAAPAGIAPPQPSDVQ